MRLMALKAVSDQVENHGNDAPVTGLVSQNCVWRNWPPGALKQHEALPLVTQLVFGFVHVADWAVAPFATDRMRAEKARSENILILTWAGKQEQRARKSAYKAHYVPDPVWDPMLSSVFPSATKLRRSLMLQPNSVPYLRGLWHAERAFDKRYLWRPMALFSEA